jgi:hypothetical protein
MRRHAGRAGVEQEVTTPGQSDAKVGADGVGGAGTVKLHA